MDRTDRIEDRAILLKFQVKQLEEQIKELRQLMNALAHALALMTDEKKTPLWVKEYYRKWEVEQKGWWQL